VCQPKSRSHSGPACSPPVDRGQHECVRVSFLFSCPSPRAPFAFAFALALLCSAVSVRRGRPVSHHPFAFLEQREKGTTQHTGSTHERESRKARHQLEARVVCPSARLDCPLRSCPLAGFCHFPDIRARSARSGGRLMKRGLVLLSDRHARLQSSAAPRFFACFNSRVIFCHASLALPWIRCCWFPPLRRRNTNQRERKSNCCRGVDGQVN
jgi:hypothetical protein